MRSKLDFNVVVPARFASTRLPGKPLLDLAGTPMLLRTVQQVEKSGARRIVVATDDKRIADACENAGVDVEMTSEHHQSGTDRMYEVVSKRGWTDTQIVINVQGDEPFIPPDSVRQVAELLLEDGASIATLATPIEAPEALTDPNVVKVVRAADKTALYFSRSLVPFNREKSEEFPLQPLRHIGIYGYRSEALRRFSEAGPCSLEQVECLEQLRALWHGWPIRVGIARQVPGPGVDTIQDLEAARRMFARSE